MSVFTKMARLSRRRGVQKVLTRAARRRFKSRIVLMERRIRILRNVLQKDLAKRRS